MYISFWGRRRINFNRKMKSFPDIILKVVKEIAWRNFEREVLKNVSAQTRDRSNGEGTGNLQQTQRRSINIEAIQED